jgi:hypothetical protein
VNSEQKHVSNEAYFAPNFKILEEFEGFSSQYHEYLSDSHCNIIKNYYHG